LVWVEKTCGFVAEAAVVLYFRLRNRTDLIKTKTEIGQ
jgi:hypothetical protein